MLFGSPSNPAKEANKKTLESTDTVPLAEEANTDITCTRPEEVGPGSSPRVEVKREK